MDFGLSEEQNLLQESVNRFLKDQVPLEEIRKFADSENQGDAIWKGLTELGIPSILIPEANGGVGLSCMDAALVAECLGFHATPAPFLGTAVMTPIALRASGKGEETLSAIATDEYRVGIAFSEAIDARAGASVQWNGTTLNGKSIFVIDFVADSYLVATADKKILLVQAEAQGLEKQILTTIDRTRITGELQYNNTPAELISEDPSVFYQTLDAGRVMLAADTLGAAQSMLNQAVAYAMQRKQFNRLIASFQAVKHMCAEMTASLEPCRSMVWYAGHALENVPEESRVTACHAKAHLSEVGQFVAKTATEVHGGMGFTDLLGLHYWFKRIGFNRQMLGAPELVREEAAQIQNLSVAS